MRIVTGAAFAISDRVMFVSGRGDLLLELVVAFVAEVANRFGEQVLQLRFMGLMTRTALSILHGLMFDLGHLQLLFKHVMAVEAEFPIWLRQQALLAGGMWIVAGETFAVLGRLMLALALGHRRLMTIQAEVLTDLHQQVGQSRLVRSVAAHALP